MRALHNADFLIAVADKNAGIISTDWKPFASYGNYCHAVK